MTTANKVLEAWERLVGKSPKQTGNEYRGISPLRMDADNETGFVLTVDNDGEHGAWTDFPGNEKGSLYDLAQRLGVALPEVSQVQDTLRQYTSLADYAQAHGVEESVFAAAGWQYHETHSRYHRPHLSFPTTNGTRFRFLDGRKPKYINPDGYKACWYGLDRALKMIESLPDQPLVLCNGESSTIVAQHYGVPAACVTGGERALPDAQLEELKSLWRGGVLIAMDCDETGKRTAEAIHTQLPNSKIVDLQLSLHGDLGDFCALFGGRANAELMTRYNRLMRNDDVEIGSLTSDLRELIAGAKPPLGMSVVMPFKSFHRLGGFAHIVPPGKLVAVVAKSGGGKTSFFETMNDLLEMRGLHGFYYGPEWTALEMLQRRIQRYGGPSYNAMELQRNYMRDISRGIHKDFAEGAMLTPEQIAKANDIMDKIDKWLGSTVMFRPTTHLEDILGRMGRRMDVMRDQGKEVAYVIFDYAQILMSKDAANSGNPFEYAVGLIKDFVMQQNIVGFVGSQITKSATGDVIQNRSIGAHQAAYITEQKFNLFITLRSIEHTDADGVTTPTNKGVAEVVKNNTGTKGPVRMKTAFEYLSWRDETW